MWWEGKKLRIIRHDGSNKKRKLLRSSIGKSALSVACCNWKYQVSTKCQGTKRQVTKRWVQARYATNIRADIRKSQMESCCWLQVSRQKDIGHIRKPFSSLRPRALWCSTKQNWYRQWMGIWRADGTLPLITTGPLIVSSCRAQQRWRSIVLCVTARLNLMLSRSGTLKVRKHLHQVSIGSPYTKSVAFTVLQLQLRAEYRL